MKKQDCIATVRQAGASELEAREIVDMLLEQKARLQKSGSLSPQNLSRAWTSTSERMKRQQAVQRRRTVLGLIRYREMADFIDSVKAQGFSALDGIQAMLVGISKRFDGARHSISALRSGIFKAWVSPMLTELEAVGDGAALWLMRKNKSFHDSIFLEMREPGSTKDENARAVSDIFNRYMEQSRVQLNAAGADIGHLEGWTPQNHDPYKLMAGGEAGRRKRSFNGAGLMDEELARELLDGVYRTLIVGKDPHLPGDFTEGGSSVRSPRNLASSLGKSRVLHFKDAASALEYHDTYGRGNILDAMLRRMEQDARALALMQRLGPNPQFTLERLLNRERLALKKDRTLSPDEINWRDNELKNALSPGIISQGKIAQWMAELSGETSWAINPTLARVGSILRATQTLSKLGAASLSVVADPYIKAASMRTNGAT